MKAIFLGGTGRSGTTAARRLIGAHPDIYEIRPELNYLPHGAGGRTWVARWHKLEHIAEQENAEYILEKTPMNVFHARDLLQIGGPGSRYIHITRDPQAVVESMLRPVPPENLARRYPSPLSSGRPYHHDEAMANIAWVETIAANLLADLGPDVVRIDRIETLDCREIWRWLGLRDFQPAPE